MNQNKKLLQKRINHIEKAIKEHDDLLKAGYTKEEPAQIELELIIDINRAIEDAQNACDEL